MKLFGICIASSMLLQSVSSMGPWPDYMELRLNEGEVVHATGSFQVLEGDPLMGASTKISVQSDIPVIASRLTAGTSAFLEPPIPYNSALVIVKSTGCAGTDIQVDLVNSTDGSTVTLQVTTNTDPTTDFLESSALFRQLECINQMGPPCVPPTGTPEAASGETSTPTESDTTTPPPQPPNQLTSQASRNTPVWMSLIVMGLSAFSMGRSRVLLLGLVACAFFATTTNSPKLVSASRELQQCTVNVEVVYWGCDMTMDVTAPAMKLRNLYQQATADLDACNCTSLSTFIDPDSPRDEERIWEYLDYDANNTISGTDPWQIPMAESSNCLVAIGRPFRDEQGVSILSKTEIMDKATEWSNGNLWKQYDSVPPTGNYPNNPSLANEWATRALGEHASVASFSAFTIALMTNGAPPNLIQDSLVAAQDELRHAQISFQVASYFRGSNVEPSVLPSSSHYFGSDIMALAKGVIEEGCIDETLSALQMAADVDAKMNIEDEWMWNITRKIALEEGNHSVLAWKTVQWICSRDAGICKELQKQFLQTERLLAVGKGKHDSSSIVFQAWSCLAGPMVCHATQGTGCFKPVECASLDEQSLVNQLVLQIKEGVKQSMSAEMISMFH